MKNDRTTEAEYEVEEHEVAKGDGRDFDETEQDFEEEDSGWVDYLDESAVAIMLIAGAFLFFVPEPVTSIAGILLFVAGLGGLVIDALN